MIDTRAYRHCRSDDWGVEPFVIDPPTSPALLQTWITADQFKTLEPYVKRMYAQRFNVPDKIPLRINEIENLFCRFNERLPMFTDFMEWVYDAASENQRKLVGKQVYGGKPPYDEVDSIKSAFSGEPEDPDYSPWLPTRPLGTDMPRSSAGHCEPYNGEDTLYNLLRDLAIRQATLHFRLQHYTRAAKGTYFNIERVRTEIEDEKRKATSEAVFGAPPRSLATERPGSSGGRRRPKVREEPFNMEKKYLQMSQSMGGLARAFTKLEGIQNELQAELLKSNEVLVAIESMNRLVARQQAEDNCSEADIRGPAVLVHSTLPTEELPSQAPLLAQADAGSSTTQRASQHSPTLPYYPDVEPHRSAKRRRHEDPQASGSSRDAQLDVGVTRKRRRLPQPQASGSATISPPGPSTTPRLLKRTRDEADIDAPAANIRSDALPPAAKKARRARSGAKRILINQDTGACEYVWDADEAVVVLRRWEVEQERAEAEARKRAEAKARKRAAGPSLKDSIVASAAAFGRRVWGAVS